LPGILSEALAMKHQITGTILPILQIGLEPGETLIAPPGELAWMTPGIRLNTTMATAGAGGIWSAITRAVSGGGLFMTEFTAEYGGGVAFAPKVPGQIVDLAVQPGHGYIAHKHGFLCATAGVQVSTTLQRSLGAGIFGGEGFVLQHISGSCQAWVALGGEVIADTLAPGQTLLVHPGHVGMFEDSVQFDIATIGGVKNALFGGDGLFLVRLTGPGRIWLQTMPVPNLAHAIAAYLPSGSSGGTTVENAEAGVAGALLRGIFSGGH
jgi:uncharacterized protein (TIGR00266 family)